MKEKACLDTGVITLFYTKDVSPKIERLIEDIQKEKIEALVARPVIIECYFHLCKNKGNLFAETCLNNFQSDIPHTLMDLNRALEFKAGALKCQYRDSLSYIDCATIALALQKNAILHTTEKELPDIPRLKVKKYYF